MVAFEGRLSLILSLGTTLAGSERHRCPDPKTPFSSNSCVCMHVCSLSVYDGGSTSCERCIRGLPMAAIPGGAACCGAPSLGECPRVYE